MSDTTAFQHRHLLSVEDLSKRDVELILETARSMKDISRRDVKKVPALRGKSVMNCFFEASTRTRTSFEIAAKRLSADIVNFAPTQSALTKGESIIDTVRTLYAMQPDMLIVRHHGSGIPLRIAQTLPNVSVVNAGDGMHEHPTQALLDLFTMQEVKGKIKNLRVTLLGDIAHSRVARSNMLLLTKMGARVVVHGPRTLLPYDVEQYGVTVAASVEDAIAEADVIMCLRVQQERLHAFAFPSTREYARYFGLSAARLRATKPDAIVMHPGPVNRGVEIAPEVADGERAVILQQVENGIAVRMAILFLLAGRDTKETV